MSQMSEEDAIQSILNGHSLDVLEQFPDNCFHTAVTSPPYWGLRDYGVEEQLGLEETPDEYVNNLCDIFDELNRVLRDDGTFWLNIGDSYAGSWGNYGDAGGGQREKNTERFQRDAYENKSDWKPPTANTSSKIKQKDLVGIPWRVALEMQSRGWYLRNDIIWAKDSCMPESVTDRCTTSHEHIFLFAKSKDYYYDQDAVREESKHEWNSKDGFSADGKRGENIDKVKGFGSGSAGNHTEAGHHPDKTQTGKNKRDVWSVNPASFSDAHFAVYPQELIKPCIKAGCPDDGIVLDPFFGAGTTGVVATKLGRGYVGIDVSQEYCDMAEERIEEKAEWGEGFPEERSLPDMWKWLTSAEGVGEKTAFDIVDYEGFESVSDIVRAVEDKEIVEIDGIGPKTAEKMHEAYIKGDSEGEDELDPAQNRLNDGE